MIEILGAGPAGLCAAINLSKEGERVRVCEQRTEPGMRFHENLQGIKDVGDVPEFIRGMNLNPKIEYRYFKKAYFGTRDSDFELDVSKSKTAFVARGGKRSLEYALFLQAEQEGVDFEFSSKKDGQSSLIVATGSSRADAAAVGSVFEDTDFPRDHYLVMFDDRYSPKGWYSYIIPISKDQVEFVNCVSWPYIPMVARLHEKAISERKVVRDFLSGKRKVASFGGSGGAVVPKSAFLGGKYYVGEAAGFQDPFMGFGIAYALKSGYLAAKAITEKKDYDLLWKEAFMANLRKDFASRLPMSIFGDRLVCMGMEKYRTGKSDDLAQAMPKLPFHSAIEEVCFRLAVLKQQATGRL